MNANRWGDMRGLALLLSMLAFAVSAQGGWAIRWAEEDPRVPRGNGWVVLSFDMRDGASGAQVRPIAPYRDSRYIGWDVDPPRLYFRAPAGKRPPMGYAASLPVQWGRTERCSRHWRIADFSVRVRCADGRHIVELARNGALHELINLPDRPELRAAPVWARDWDEDGSIELLLEVGTSGQPDRVVLYSIAADVVRLAEHDP